MEWIIGILVFIIIILLGFIYKFLKEISELFKNLF